MVNLGVSDIDYKTMLKETIVKISKQLGKSYTELFDDIFTFYVCKKTHSGDLYRYTHKFSLKDSVYESESVPMFDRTGEYAIERYASEAFFELYKDVMNGKTTKEVAVETIMYTILHTYLMSYTYDSYRDFVNMPDGYKLLDVTRSKSLVDRTRFMKYFVFVYVNDEDTTEFEVLRDAARNKCGCAYLLNYLAYMVVYFFTHYKFCMYSELDVNDELFLESCYRP